MDLQERKFDRLNSTTPQPEDWELEHSTRDWDARAELSHVRTEVRSLIRYLPVRYGKSAAYLKIAQDALNRALSEAIVMDSNITQIAVAHEADHDTNPTVTHR
jgi:hypothetical protein